MFRAFLLSTPLWGAFAGDAQAVDWAGAMQMYYKGFNPLPEMLVTLGLVVVGIGGGIGISRWRTRRREERIAKLKQENKDFHDAL